MKCVPTAMAGNSRMGMVLRATVLSTAAVMFCAGEACAGAAPQQSLAIKAKTVYIGDGRVVKNATVLIRDGRIAVVGSDVLIPQDTQVIEVKGGSVTPGLIDANARIEPTSLIATSRRVSGVGGQLWGRRPTLRVGARATRAPGREDEIIGPKDTNQTDADPAKFGGYEALHAGPPEDDAAFASGVQSNAVLNEQGSEVVPHIRVLDALDLGSPDFERLVRGGVTTVCASPDASAVIGARGAILHTGGARDRRVLREAAAVKAVIGSDPSMLGSYNRRPSRGSVSLYGRRPTTRMGLVWVFRKAFYDAVRRGRGLEAYGSDTASPEASAVLREVLEGKVPLRIQARLQQDIHTALRLAKEFELRFTLEEATEAYFCLDELQKESVPVIFGPIYERPGGIRLRSGEGSRSRYYTFRALIEAGIQTALSAQEFREEDGLARQAMYAMRFGVGFDDALRAVTQTPARLLGIDGQLGTLEPGKRADMVIWSGRPLAATSTAAVVLIDGKVVVDRR